MKPKAKTIIERHGFVDSDRQKSKHDEIQMWVYKNFLELHKTVFPNRNFPSTWSLDLKLEYPVTGGYNNSQIIGFVDVFCLSYGLAIEVKTQIPVIGDLIRQIQFYRNYLSGPAWLVVSPDDRAAEILNSQGIYFYKYKSPGELF